MVAAINHDYISKLPPVQTPPVQVQFVTCHHGLTQPRQLTSVLAEAMDQKGIDSAVALYHELRQKYESGCPHRTRPNRRPRSQTGDILAALMVPHAQTLAQASRWP